jgi:hypothetical protein
MGCWKPVTMVFMKLKKQLFEIAAMIVFKLKVDLHNPAVLKVTINLSNMFGIL